MTRRKGERPIERPLDRFTPDHPVARTISQGDHWFYAWLAQKSTPLVRLARITGIPAERFFPIQRGGDVSRAELDALARAWSVSTQDLIRSMAEPRPTIVD